MRSMVEGAIPSTVRGLAPSTAFGGPPPRFTGEDRVMNPNRPQTAPKRKNSVGRKSMVRIRRLV
jgi:hypothetical protein